MTAPAVPGARLIVESALYQHVMAERDRYRAALIELRDDHETSAAYAFCEQCEMAWPCPTRDYIDDVLGGAS